MYNASADFLHELKQDSRFEFIRGTIGGQAFNDDNIISMSYSNQASDTKDVSFGLAYVGVLNCVLADLNINRGSFKGLQINLEFGLQIPPDDPDDDPTIEWIPAGVFFVSEALWTDTGISITATDAMTKFDKSFAVTQTSGKVFDFLSLICSDCNVTLGVNQSYCEGLPNGDQTLGLYPTNDIKTYRDLLGWVAQTIGGFATIDRQGRLVVRSWADSGVVDTLTDDDREVTSCSFSDYETQYAGISIVNIDSKTTQFYGSDSGSVINLGSNPLLQYGTAEVKDAQRNALAAVAQGITWTPFQCSILSNLVYDLGDVIRMNNAIQGTGTLYCCVMAISWTIKHLTTLGGFGANPALASGKSATDKAISGLLSRTSENEMIIHSFVNAEEIELEDEEEIEICEIHFATISPKIVTLWHEIDLDLEAVDPTEPITCIAHYYINDEEIESYHPTTTWDNDGKHLLTLNYFLGSLGEGQRYDWRVNLELLNATGTIGRENVHAVLQGQGLVAVDVWDGLVEIADDTYILTLGGEAFFDYNDESVVTSLREPDVVTIADPTYSLTLGGEAFFDYDDESVVVSMVRPRHTRITEDEEDRVTEDGETRITEGDF